MILKAQNQMLHKEQLVPLMLLYLFLIVLNLSGSYSNFSTYTNVKPNQFEDINDDNLIDEALETLDYRQLTQNASLQLYYILSSRTKAAQNLSFNYNLNDVANEQNGASTEGATSTFHNMLLAHSINFTERFFTINSTINATYNAIGFEDSFTWGPTVSLSKGYFNQTLQTQFSVGYNSTTGSDNITSNTNLKAGATYILKDKHNFNLNAIQLFRTGGSTGDLNELTATLGYSYTFGLKKPKISFKKREKPIKTDSDSIRIRYRKYDFRGLAEEITPKLIEIPKKEGFASLINGKQRRLNILMDGLSETEKTDKAMYKEIALNYLRELDHYFDFAEFYNKILYKAYLKLRKEAHEIDNQIRSEYDIVNAKINSAENKDPEDLKKAARFRKAI